MGTNTELRSQLMLLAIRKMHVSYKLTPRFHGIKSSWFN